MFICELINLCVLFFCFLSVSSIGLEGLVRCGIIIINVLLLINMVDCFRVFIDIL